jgi:AcrR family transcriptional regulator
VSEQELSRRERKKRANRARILKAARDLFQAHGFDDTSVEDIAETADVSKSTFFNYFPTKESLLVAIAAEEVRDLRRLVTVDLASVPSAVEKIQRVMRLLVADTAPRLRLTRRVLLETMMRPSDMPTPVTQVELLFERLVKRAQAQGEIRADLDPTGVASALTGAYFAAFSRWIAAGSDEAATLGSELEAVLEMLFEGIAGPNCHLC